MGLVACLIGCVKNGTGQLDRSGSDPKRSTRIPRSAKATSAPKTLDEKMATSDSVSVFTEGTFEDQVRVFFYVFG